MRACSNDYVFWLQNLKLNLEPYWVTYENSLEQNYSCRVLPHCPHFIHVHLIGKRQEAGCEGCGRGRILHGSWVVWGAYPPPMLTNPHRPKETPFHQTSFTSLGERDTQKLKTWARKEDNFWRRATQEVSELGTGRIWQECLKVGDYVNVAWKSYIIGPTWVL